MSNEFLFVDGSGGGTSTAHNKAILQMFEYNSGQSFFLNFQMFYQYSA